MATAPSMSAALHWRGKARDLGRAYRGGVLALLILGCVFIVATQFACIEWGSVHILGALVPIAMVALLAGPLIGAAAGGLVGLLLFLEALFIPQSVYETFFAAPWNSVVLFALAGFVFGMLFAVVDAWESNRDEPCSRSRHILNIALCCIVLSAVLSILFVAGSRLYLFANELEPGVAEALFATVSNVPNVAIQVVANTIITTTCVVLGDLWFAEHDKNLSEYRLGEQFRMWLIALMIAAYMVVASVSYVGISVEGVQGAQAKMAAAAQSLEGQLEERDELLEDVIAEAEVQQSKVEKLHNRTVDDLAEHTSLGDNVLVILAQDNDVLSSTNPDFVDRDYQNVVQEEFAGGAGKQGYVWVNAPSADPASRVLSYALMDEVPYERGEQRGTYQLMVALPASEIFHYRRITMHALLLVFLLLLLAVFWLVSLLLRKLVLAGFSQTNESLERITGGDLDEVVDAHSSVEFVQLSAGINSTVGALKDSMQRIQEGIDRELHTARAIQQSALPQTFPPYPNIGAFDIHAFMRPAREVGGDFYDFFLLDDHTLALLIADVSGKGVPAALFMMEAKSEIVGYLRTGISVSDAIESANANLCEGNETGMFVTVWAATLDFATGRLTYVNAGHNPPLLRRDGSWEWLRQRSGIFLGAMEEARYPSFTVMLRPHDELLLYTDGVTEACNTSYDEFGESRLEELVSDADGLRPSKLTQAIEASVTTWAGEMEQSDDITMLALEFGVGPITRYAQTFVATEDNVGRVQDYVCAELDKRLCPVSAKNQVCIAIEELFVNVCRYAYQGQQAQGTARLSYAYSMNPSTITVELRDEGVAFDPLSRADSFDPNSMEFLEANGWGIPMVRKCVDTITYQREGNQNVLTFTKSW
ncbi:MAG: SpoIIE family protein phosphatase [Coriobacteriales bacterium]|nr:SpoIIE family protein phosphatase [Coriobacteriales bacterium]